MYNGLYLRMMKLFVFFEKYKVIRDHSRCSFNLCSSFESFRNQLAIFSTRQIAEICFNFANLLHRLSLYANVGEPSLEEHSEAERAKQLIYHGSHVKRKSAAPLTSWLSCPSSESTCTRYKLHIWKKRTKFPFIILFYLPTQFCFFPASSFCVLPSPPHGSLFVSYCFSSAPLWLI